MKPITSSSLFLMMTKQLTDLPNHMGAIDTEINRVELSKVKHHLDLIKRRYNYNFKEKIFHHLEQGNLVLVFNPENINITAAIPVVRKISDGKVKVFINLTEEARINKTSGDIDIDPRKLYALLQTGLLMYELADESIWTRVTMTPGILRTSGQIYSKMASKVLDKLFAINLNSFRSDAVYFLMAKFMLVNQLDMKPDDANRLAKSAILNDTSENILFDLDTNFSEDAYIDLFKFLDNLRDNIDGLGNLSFRSFSNEWIKMYGYKTMLALDYYPLFLHTIFSTIINSHLTSEYIIEPLVGKESISLYNTFNTIIR